MANGVLAVSIYKRRTLVWKVKKHPEHKSSPGSECEAGPSAISSEPPLRASCSASLGWRFQVERCLFSSNIPCPGWFSPVFISPDTRSWYFRRSWHLGLTFTVLLGHMTETRLVNPSPDLLPLQDPSMVSWEPPPLYSAVQAEGFLPVPTPSRFT